MPALMGRGMALRRLERHAEALADLEAVLSRDAANPDAWNNRGLTLRSLGRMDEALESFDRAIALAPDFAEALNHRGDLNWNDRVDYAAAVADLARALALEPQRPWLAGKLLHLRMMGAEWNGIEQAFAHIHDGVRQGQPAAHPFVYQAIAETPAQLQACSRIWAQLETPPAAARPAAWPAAWPGHDRIRLGYVAGEFREHALGYLVAGLFECHDRSRFEVIAFNNGGHSGGALRRRLAAGFDRFVDIDGLDDAAAAARVRAEEIDVLVNLNGYFGLQRSGLFAQRPAAVQVSYLGFPATLGAGWMDYVLADRIVLPPQEQSFYDEKVVYLPETYWVNDSRRAIADRRPSRAACGLPEQAFVFCNFNSSYKLTPKTFAGWMRILAQAPGSVLWLYAGDNPVFAANIRRHAAACGVDPGRVICAGLVSSEDNLARLKLADLALDSLPYNAHTTAADVLWTGVPILTQRGTTWPGRVAASLLTAIGLPELVTETAQAFEAKAVALARDPAALAALKQTLASNRRTTPLFDTARWTRHSEAAFAEMHARALRGESPAGFDVAPL
jgi:predicted O-linked N-acetylglucosamine transferase (SPINDLY family)